MTIQQITADKLKEIRKRLPKGSSDRIAEITGLSKTRISNVLNNKGYNYRILEAAYLIIEEENQKILYLMEQHKKMLSFSSELNISPKKEKID